MKRQSRIDFESRQRKAAGCDGSGRDTFITFAPHGEIKGKIYRPGQDRHNFFTQLRGSVNNFSIPDKRQTQPLTFRKKGRAVVRNLLDDMLDKQMAFGKPSKATRLEGVGELISGGPEHQLEEHTLPGRRRIHEKRPSTASADARRRRSSIVRRNISIYSRYGQQADPYKTRQEAFLKKSRKRQAFASNYERHSSGRVFVGHLKEKSGVRDLK
jgi:hypothetical protein